jgi:CBS domain-containing protein
MCKVADILSSKGRQVYTIEDDMSVFEAIKKMVEKNVGALVITHEGQVCGMLTERDYLRRIVLEGRTSRNTLVKDVMTSNVICVDPSRTVQECMATMTAARIRHLPVMDGAELVGVVSIGDLVKYLSKEQETHIRYLNDYINGKYPG